LRFVAPKVANRITMAEERVQACAGEAKQARVLFADIEGPSIISEKLEPKARMGALNEYFTALCKVITPWGVIIRFEGDAMLITFNTMKSGPAHAAKAVRTAAGIQGAVARRAFGAKDRLLFTVHNEEASLAVRLAQFNKTCGTYIMATGSGGARGRRQKFSPGRFFIRILCATVSLRIRIELPCACRPHSGLDVDLHGSRPRHIVHGPRAHLYPRRAAGFRWPRLRHRAWRGPDAGRRQRKRKVIIIAPHGGPFAPGRRRRLLGRRNHRRRS